MMNAKNRLWKAALLFLIATILKSAIVNGQEAVHYNLDQLLHDNRLIIQPGQKVETLNEPQYPGISLQRVVWIKDLAFDEGRIDVDLRGRDVFLQSFLGIAFHGVDNARYEVVYFRPFNFRHPDTTRRKWSVQYMSLPEYDYSILRKEHPMIYENSVDPVPGADDWFHATVMISSDSIKVYVNHSAQPSLNVKKLNSIHSGMIGLWDDGLPGDFSNLSIHQKNKHK